MQKFTATPLGREHLRRERNKKLALKSQCEGQIQSCKEIQRMIGNWCEQSEAWQAENPLAPYLIHTLDARRLNLEDRIDEIQKELDEIKVSFESSKS